MPGRETDKEVINKQWSEIRKIRKIADKNELELRFVKENIEIKWGAFASEIKATVKSTVNFFKTKFTVVEEKVYGLESKNVTRENKEAESKRYYTRLIIGGLIVAGIGFVFGRGV